MDEQEMPKWLTFGEPLFVPIDQSALTIVDGIWNTDLHIFEAPMMALLHFLQCYDTADVANREGRHAIAICLVRQCIEALTVVDVGLQEDSFAKPLLASWKQGKRTQGNLRASLETHAWNRYGKGLWSESWGEYFRNLAGAVQPYAHYSSKLQEWQFSILAERGYEDGLAIGTFGLNTYDALKASRITLFLCLLQWTLARILLVRNDPRFAVSETQIREWGEALGASRLLFKNNNWDHELIAHMFFKPGVNWREE